MGGLVNQFHIIQVAFRRALVQRSQSTLQRIGFETLPNRIHLFAATEILPRLRKSGLVRLRRSPVGVVLGVAPVVRFAGVGVVELDSPGVTDVGDVAVVGLDDGDAVGGGVADARLPGGRKISGGLVARVIVSAGGRGAGSEPRTVPERVALLTVGRAGARVLTNL